MCATWLIHMCDMTHSYGYSLRYVGWLVHVWDMDSFICVTWLIYVCGMTHSYARDKTSRGFVHFLCGITHSCMWYYCFMCVTWLIHAYEMTYSFVRHTYLVSTHPYICMIYIYYIYNVYIRLFFHSKRLPKYTEYWQHILRRYSPFPRRWDSKWSSECKSNPRWSSQVSFLMAHLKRDLNCDHRGFRFAFRRAFRVLSSRERAIAQYETLILVGSIKS